MPEGVPLDFATCSRKASDAAGRAEWRRQRHGNFQPLGVAVSDFRVFLKEYGIVGLALGVIIGGKAGELVTAVVEGLLMPVIGLFLPNGTWQKWVVGEFKLGIVLAALINFIIVAYFVYFVSKRLLRESTVVKK